MTLVGAVLTTIYFCDGLDIKSGTPLSLRIFWLLWNHSIVCAIVIDTFYWSFLYKGEKVILVEIVVHITNCLVLILDLFIVKHPPRLALIVYTSAGEIIYVILTIVYTVNGGLNK